MFKQVLLILALFTMCQAAQADECPPFYRFVDFGTFDNDGMLRRGGPVFRAFDENTTPLPQVDQTVCVTVAEVSKDGRQLPIPVVSHIEIDMDVATVNLSSLTFDAAENIPDAAEANAAPHRDRLAMPNVERALGAEYLCASFPDLEAISCQIVPPYGTAALVIYCDAQLCEMPVLELNARVVAGATWPRAGTDADDVALDALSRLQDLVLFLEPHI